MNQSNTVKDEPPKVPRPRRAPVWIIQLVALLLLGFFVWLEATEPEFEVNPIAWGLLVASIVPPELISRFGWFSGKP